MTSPTSLPVYTQGFGTAFTGAPFVSTVDPGSANITAPNGPFKIGQEWINSTDNAAFFLTSLSSVGGAVTANWLEVQPASSALLGLTADTGGSAFPVAGLIRVVGNAHQLSSTATTGQIAFAFTNGISIGSFQGIAPPVGGLMMPGELVVGTSVPNVLAVAQFNASNPEAYGIILQGNIATIDGGGQQFGILSNIVLSALSSSSLMVGIASRNGYVVAGGQTTTLCAGVQSFNNYTNCAGTITNAIGVVSEIGLDTTAGGTITNGYGGYFHTPAFGTNKVALYADNISSGVVASGTPTAGTLRSAPPASITSTTAFGAITFATAKQNTLGYDIIVSGSINITDITAAVVFLGVGPATNPTGSAITETITNASPSILGFSAYVPSGYYLYLHATGTGITVSSVTSVVTPV